MLPGKRNKSKEEAEELELCRKEGFPAGTVRASPHLVIYCALAGQICFVSCQCDNDVGAGLSLQFLHPVLSTCECILEDRESTFQNVPFRQNTSEKLACNGLL